MRMGPDDVAVVRGGCDGPTIREWCRRIDDGPFSCVAVGERVAYPSHDLITSLAFAAAATRRVRLVSTIVVLPSHDPVRVAKQAATIDVLSEGRLTLGVGVGGRDQDYLAVGAAPTRRFARLDEQVATMRAVWRGEAPVPDVPPIGPGAGPARRTAAADRGDGTEVARPVGAVGRRAVRLRPRPDPVSVATTFPACATRGRRPAGPSRPWLSTSCWFALGDGASDRLYGYARNYLATFGDAAASAMAGLCRLDDAGRLRETVAALAETGCDEFVLVPTTDDVAELDRLERALDATPRVPPMGCGCLLALGAMLSPRLAIFIVWVFTDRMGIAFQRFWMGLLGFLFLPWTTLAWALAYRPHDGVTGFGWFIVIFAFLVDLSTHAAASQARRREAIGPLIPPAGVAGDRRAPRARRRRRDVRAAAPFGFMALHGGSLERGTAEVARRAADACGASIYAVEQPEDLQWHIPSHLYDPAAAPNLGAFLDHVDVVVSVHGYGREGWWTRLLVGGANRDFAARAAHDPARASRRVRGARRHRRDPA